MLKMLHSGWAYITLIILIFAVVNALIGLTSKKEFKDKDLRVSLFTLIIAHLQLIIGFIAYFVSAQFAYVLDNGMGAAMKEPEIRLFVIEHPLMMILAIVLITMGFSKNKRLTWVNSKLWHYTMELPWFLCLAESRGASGCHFNLDKKYCLLT